MQIAMKLSIFVITISTICACVAILPKIGDEHPAGYNKLVQLKPECADPSLNLWTDCLVGAEMLESHSPERATTIFLTHWEKSIFGYISKQKEKADMEASISTSYVYGKVHRDNIVGMNSISIPILREVYLATSCDYTRKMLKHVDIIEVDSKSSFDTFREAHMRASTAD